jgi:Tfp pilus assembly major pilin PilA
MTCKHCGKEITPNDKICPHCHEDLVPNAGKPRSNAATKVILGCAVAIAGVFFIGILAAIAIPKFANTKEKAYVASMRQNLLDLRTAEETYHATHGTYTNDPTLITTTGFTTLGITAASATGWKAMITSPATSIFCRIGVGSDSIPNVGNGIVQCKHPEDK